MEVVLVKTGKAISVNKEVFLMAIAKYMLAITVFTAICSTIAWAQAPGAPPSDRVEKLADGVYVAVVGQNVCVSVGNDGVLIVDDQTATAAPRIRRQIATLSDSPVRLVVNTHWHADHIGGNALFGGAGALIIAHENTRNRMISGTVGQGAEASYPPGALPLITFEDRLTLHFNGDDVELIHFPHAHTDGDVAVRFRKANVIDMGDLFTRNGYSAIESDQGGGSIDGTIAAYDQILRIVDNQTKVIPGHGPISGKQDLEVYRQMLVTVRDQMAVLIRNGKSLDEIFAAQLLKDFDGSWRPVKRPNAITPEGLIRMIYVDLIRYSTGPVPSPPHS